MKKLKTLLYIILVIIVLYAVQWMFQSKNKTGGDIELNTREFITDPALLHVVQYCIPLYNAEFRRLNPREKGLPDLITANTFNESELILINHHTNKKEVNMAAINIINEFFNSLYSPMSDPKMINQCFINYGYTIKDIKRVKQKFSNYANSN